MKPAEPPDDERWRILVVCTANVCRSPVAERLLQQRLDTAGHSAVVSSAGTRGGTLSPHHDTVRAAATVGADLIGHTSRLLTGEVIRADGASLVLTMTREHLRSVVSLEQTAWARTFTLRELIRRGLDAPLGAVSLDEWLSAAHNGRRAADLLQPSASDDISDPYGGSYRDHVDMAQELDRLVTRLVKLFPI